MQLEGGHGSSLGRKQPYEKRCYYRLTDVGRYIEQLFQSMHQRLHRLELIYFLIIKAV